MESYYSSDEEIAWGPVTIREIIGDLKRPWLRPKRRHTLTCTFPMENSGDGTSLCREGRPSNNLNVSPTPTEYFTANESVPNSENLNNANCVDVTCLNFVKNARELESEYDIANFQQTLVENSYASEDEKEIKTDSDSLCDDVNCSPVEKSLDVNSSYEDSKINLISEKEIKEDIILVSDEDESYISDNVSLDDSLCNARLSAENGTDELSKSSEGSNNEDSMMSCKDDLYKYTRLHIQGESTSLGVSEEKPTDEIEKSRIARLPPMAEQKPWSTLQVPTPDIKVTPFDGSLSNDDSLHLDDTMEEINRLLNQGLNYTMSDEEPMPATPSCKQEPMGLQFASSSIISGSFIQDQPDYLSSTKEKINSTPSRIPVLDKKPADQCSLKTTPDNNFKIPSVVPRTKANQPTTPRPCPSHLKNVVSPVALYIKNSPGMVLKQNVRQRDLSRVVVPKMGKQNSAKENIPDMPEVVYKPSKRQIISSEKEIVLPNSLKRMNVVEPIVTKHEGRIHQSVNKARVNRELLDNVTDASINTTMLDSSGNTSVLTKRQAFIK